MSAKEMVVFVVLCLFLLSGIVTTAMGVVASPLALFPGAIQLAIGGIGLAILIKRHGADGRGEKGR